MISATSSSESEHEQLYHSRFRTNSYRRTPLCPALGQPIIYYAEVKPKKRNRRNRENEKNKSNCFAKAFRWYTQEHIPFKNNPSSNDTNNDDINGFAKWLDEKYNEYLQTNRIEQNQCILSQTSTLQILNTAKIFDTKVKNTKKFPRLKSLWNKRAKSMIGRDKTNFIMKSNQSLKITYKSKSLSRLASACCQRSDLQTRNRSNSSIISDTSALHTKLKPISKSWTSVLREKEIYVIPFDFLQDTNHKDLKHNTDEIKRNDRKKVKQIFPKNESLSSVKSQQRKNVSCQCFHDISEKIDASTTFEKRMLNMCNCYERKPQDPRQIAMIQETRTSESALVSDNVQTSDHSISLGNDVFQYSYPVFMKIVCADKVK